MTEAQEMAEFVRWFRLTYPAHSHLLRVSLAGINLSGPKAARMVNQMRSQGIHPGESDICIAAPGSLFCEHKSGEGSHPLSEDQAIYLERHLAVGNIAAQTKGLDSLKAAVTVFMADKWEL
jgi:hypothetical protein